MKKLHTQPVSALLRSALFVITMLSMSSFAIGASLTTDASDYAPGSAVTLTGSGFSAGELVTMQVVHADGLGDNDNSIAHQPWNVEADGDGNLVAIWNVPADEDESGATLLATADGQT